MDFKSYENDLYKGFKMLSLAGAVMSAIVVIFAYYIGYQAGIESGKKAGKEECGLILENEFDVIRKKHHFTEVLPEDDFIRMQTIIKMHSKITGNASVKAFPENLK